MTEPNKIFRQTVHNYLDKVSTIDLDTIAKKLGIRNLENKSREDQFLISVFNNRFSIGEKGFYTGSKNKASYEIIIVLCKYILMCPDEPPKCDDLVSFRDFKDSGPLTVYFSNEVENKINTSFATKLLDLELASKAIGGYTANVNANYDYAVQFDALPKIPITLLFNDKDEEFDAQTTLLFERRAENYLDAECLAILGNILFQLLVPFSNDNKPIAK